MLSVTEDTLAETSVNQLPGAGVYKVALLNLLATHGRVSNSQSTGSVFFLLTNLSSAN